MRIQHIIIKIISLICVVILFSCMRNKPFKDFPEYIPEIILINNDLEFTAGCLDKDGWFGYYHETPAFKTILDPYYIGKYEVRNDEFKYFVKDSGYFDSSLWSVNGWQYIRSAKRSQPVDWIEGNEPWVNCPLSNSADKPINNISWYEAEAYCNWLSKITGHRFSLPSEIQWERAARGPDPGRIFPWGNENDTTKYNNIVFNNILYPVGSFNEGRSYDGCYDLAGNLEEFCSDLYDINIYQEYKHNEPVYNPMGPDSNTTQQRALRGTVNMFDNDPEIAYQITTFRRMCCYPNDCFGNYGFRIVKMMTEGE